MRGKLPRLVLLIATTALLFGVVESAAAVAVVVPNAQATVEGNTGNSYPFSCFPSQRYQQVYLGSEVGSGTIMKIAFRPDGTSGMAFGPTTITGITITLSSTTAAPDSLSTTFAANVGSDVRTVFSGNLTLQSANTGGPPRNFDIVVPLMTPFFFNASTGRNLLLDVTIPTCASATLLDAQFGVGDSVTRAVADTSGSASPTADFTDSQGLVTQFTFAPNPAPALGVAGLLACLLLLLIIGARRSAGRVP